VEAVEVAETDTTFDLLGVQAAGEQLTEGDDSPLPRGNSRDALVDFSP
jgi:hypothetical protein